MTTELEHPYEQIAEQIMYAKGAASIEAVVQQALDTALSQLTEVEKAGGVRGMIQAGFDSGTDNQSFDEFFDELLGDLRARSHEGSSSEQAA